MQQTIQQELQALVEEGTETASHTAFLNINASHTGQMNLAFRKYQEFKTRALNLISRAFGTDSDHYKQLNRLNEGLKPGLPEFIHYAACQGIVEAAHHDFESGLLFNMRAIISAELLGDFIDQANTLLTANYHIAAASLSGAVLEDTLRKLWIKAGWSMPKKSNLNLLNSELAKAGVYGALTQKQITAYAELRNNAGHGNYDLVASVDVENMISWIRRFTEERLR